MPESTDPPKGQRYDFLYEAPAELRRDIPSRARLRVARVVDDYCDARSDSTAPGRYLEREMGIRIVQFGSMHSYISWDGVFESCTATDFNTQVTLLLRFAKQNRAGADRLLVQMRRVFSEESLAFSIDDLGGIHPKFDDAFEVNLQTTLAGLSSTRYAAARADIEAAEQALMTDPISAKDAIRGVFDAAENIFKLMFPDEQRLGNSDLPNRVNPIIDDMFSDSHNKIAAKKIAQSFKSWVEAAHFYRHAPGQEEPIAPPAELVLTLVTQGFSFVRWLVVIDRHMEASSNPILDR